MSISLPLSVKDVNGHGYYNISLHVVKYFHLLLVVITTVSQLIKLIGFRLAHAAVLRWHGNPSIYHVPDLLFAGARSSARSNVCGSIWISICDLGSPILMQTKI